MNTMNTHNTRALKPSKSLVVGVTALYIILTCIFYILPFFMAAEYDFVRFSWWKGLITIVLVVILTVSLMLHVIAKIGEKAGIGIFFICGVLFFTILPTLQFFAIGTLDNNRNLVVVNGKKLFTNKSMWFDNVLGSYHEQNFMNSGSECYQNCFYHDTSFLLDNFDVHIKLRPDIRISADVLLAKYLEKHGDLSNRDFVDTFRVSRMFALVEDVKRLDGASCEVDYLELKQSLAWRPYDLHYERDTMRVHIEMRRIK